MYSPPFDWDRLKRPQLGVTKTSVSGVGDEAFAETAANFTTLYGKKGDTTFMVRVYGVTAPDKVLAIETSIAKAVAAKL
jgi:hypothetical protein